MKSPKCPIYIPSKGRWDSRLTMRAFEEMRVPYSVVVEEQEYEKYCSVIDKRKVLVLDKQYQRNYDAFDNSGMTKSKGSGPARNFIWDHAISKGAKWHWVIDDNIKSFIRLCNNTKIQVSDGVIFRCMEDFAQRYTNVAMAGPTYAQFAKRKQQQPPFILNTRIYSCILIRNDLPFRWRGRYNEDTDLSLRVLKAGYCTINFNAFLQQKATTMTMKGGNTDELYSKGTTEKSAMIEAMHPDVCKVTFKFGRVYHQIDYSRFECLGLIMRDGVKIKDGIDNYGMELQTI